MPPPSWICEDAWAIIQAAKAVAQREGAAEISPHHLLQGVALKAPELIRTALKALELTDGEIKKVMGDVTPGSKIPEPQGSLPLSKKTSEIVQTRAKALAAEYPAAMDAKVAPVHLWVSLCETLEAWEESQQTAGWLRDSRGKLKEAAKAQLPPRKPSVYSLKGNALQVLAKYCRRNLTELARQGRLSQAFGVDEARQQLARCLLRKNKRSVVLTGPAGAGKTKLVEDLAVAIARGDLPELAGCEVFELDLVLFTRGTHLVGSQAERWAELTEVLRANPERIVLFIDELHTIVGIQIGGQALDLANALKALMVDDKVRIIGATTFDEYRRHIEGDPALVRRFAQVPVPEPDRNTTLGILEGVAPEFEAYYRIRFCREALEAIYDLASLYEPNKSFPSKAIDLLDEVGVSVSMKGSKQRTTAGAEPVIVQPDDVQETLKSRGIQEISSVDVAALLKERVVGQDHAADALADAVIVSSFGYGKANRAGPRAVILFLGPPGTGKSYMAQVLSDILFPGRDCLLTLDMTEFSGPHSGEHARFRLLGPPPPFVGWEQGGLLTRHAQQHPVSVALVDEFEKANPEAQNILLRIFHEGMAQDGRGRIASFRGMYFILTANAAKPLWGKVKKIGFKLPKADMAPTESAIRDMLASEGFAPALLSRISHIVLFRNLTDADLRMIAKLKLANLRDHALMEDFLLVEYDEDSLSGWLVGRIAPALDVRRLTAMFERCVEIPLARWRMQQGSRRMPPVRLKPGEGEVQICTEDADQNAERAVQLLLERVAALYGKREDRARKERAARARFGTMN